MICDEHIVGIIFNKKEMAKPYFHLAEARLSSAQMCFTSEFGMGSGGAILQSSPKGIKEFFINLAKRNDQVTRTISTS